MHYEKSRKGLFCGRSICLQLNTYMKISELLCELAQPRVKSGSKAQSAVINHLQDVFGDDFELVSQAKPSSKAPDLVTNIHGVKTQFEVKGRGTEGGTVKLYEARIKRGQRDPLLDSFARAHSEGKARTFEEYIDLLRKGNPAIGFPGDEGVTAKAGKIYVGTDNSNVRTLMRRHLMKILKEGDDDYFAIYTAATGRTDIYDSGSSNSELQAPRIPNIRRVVLGTYGSAGTAGQIRLAIKVNFTK